MPILNGHTLLFPLITVLIQNYIKSLCITFTYARKHTIKRCMTEESEWKRIDAADEEQRERGAGGHALQVQWCTRQDDARLV